MSYARKPWAGAPYGTPNFGSAVATAAFVAAAAAVITPTANTGSGVSDTVLTNIVAGRSGVAGGMAPVLSGPAGTGLGYGQPFYGMAERYAQGDPASGNVNVTVLPGTIFAVAGMVAPDIIVVTVGNVVTVPTTIPAASGLVAPLVEAAPPGSALPVPNTVGATVGLPAPDVFAGAGVNATALPDTVAGQATFIDPLVLPPPGDLFFSPPTDNDVSPIADYWGYTPQDAQPSALALAKYFARPARGRNVYLMEDNTISEQQPPNWDPNDPTGPYAASFTYIGGRMGQGFTSFTNPPGQQVKRVFFGGARNRVTPEEASLLTAAGYTISKEIP